MKEKKEDIVDIEKLYNEEVVENERKVTMSEMNGYPMEKGNTNSDNDDYYTLPTESAKKNYKNKAMSHL